MEVKRYHVRAICFVKQEIILTHLSCTVITTVQLPYFQETSKWFFFFCLSLFSVHTSKFVNLKGI